MIIDRLSTFDEILQSVYYISPRNGSGTGLIFRLSDDKIVLVTAKHMFPNNKDSETVYFEFLLQEKNKRSDTFNGILLCPHKKNGDICAVIIDNATFSCPVNFCNIGLPSHFSIGEEVFILGFPFILDSKTMVRPCKINDGIVYPEAILKHGYISSHIIIDNDESRILLDAYNNSGFSGSPVIKKGHLPNSENFGYVPIGVIGGYYYDVVNGGIDKRTNSGFAKACPFELILERIKEYISESEVQENECQ